MKEEDLLSVLKIRRKEVEVKVKRKKYNTVKSEVKLRKLKIKIN